MKSRYCLLVALVCSLNLSNALAYTVVCDVAHHYGSHVLPGFEHVVTVTMEEASTMTEGLADGMICTGGSCLAKYQPCSGMWTMPPYTVNPATFAGNTIWLDGPLPAGCNGLFYVWDANQIFKTEFQYQDPNDPFGTWFTGHGLFPTEAGISCPYPTPASYINNYP
jgi:hypothetical protein